MTIQKSIITTTCFALREITVADAPSILALTNDPDWLRFIGDRGVTDLDSATQYIEERFLQAYREFSFGLWAITHRDDDAVLGVCGLLQRDHFAFPDLGYALFPDYRGKGIVQECAIAVLDWAKNKHISYVFATTTKDNIASIHILKKLGFQYSREYFEDGQSLNLYQRALHQNDD